MNTTHHKWFGPSEWLEQLARCQTGETSCMRTLEIIERETVSMDWVIEQQGRLLELCHMIEALPAGEQQTAISIFASSIHKEWQRVVSFVYAEQKPTPQQMTPAQTTPPASPASPVPTAGPTKEAIAIAKEVHRKMDELGQLYDEELATLIDRITHLPELLAVVEAAKRARKLWWDWPVLTLPTGEEVCEMQHAFDAIGQSLAAYRAATAKEGASS